MSTFGIAEMRATLTVGKARAASAARSARSVGEKGWHAGYADACAEVIAMLDQVLVDRAEAGDAMTVRARVQWELLVCSKCGHEHVRPCRRRFVLRCQCGGQYDVFELRRGEQLQTEKLAFGCAITAERRVSATVPVSATDPLRSGPTA